MTNEQLEIEVRHLATKEELQKLGADFHREMMTGTRWLIGTMIAVQIPTWLGLLQIWSFLATIAAKLPK
jgi:hypothetical protein